MSTDRNRNSQWAGLIVEELVRLGCDTFFLAPGLRSSPLAAAVGRHERARSVVHYDERGSAFAALGFARESGRPGVWITTSGTAVANGFPAVVEASVDAVPLVLLTADRPPELRETGANQTVPQAGLFGAYVRWFFDLPVATPDVDPAFVLTTVDQAVYRAKAARGPVHVNCMYREPLLEYDAPKPSEKGTEAPDRWRDSSEPYTRYAGGRRGARFEEAITRLSASVRPICVLGRLHDPAVGEAVVSWADRAGVPVLPDVVSGMRLGRVPASVVPYHDLLLSSDGFRERHMPDGVLLVGRAPVSKRVLGLISNPDANPVVAVVDGPERIDPGHRVSDHFEMDAEAMVSIRSASASQLGIEEGWLTDWRSASDAVEGLLENRFGGASLTGVSEQAIAYRLCECLPADHHLTIASSLPIRHVNTFGRAGANRVRVVANRGASGIDGTIATAAGCAVSLGRRGTVLLGDQALLHDLNSLSLAAKTRTIVVVLNNDGGGIFSYLPVSGQQDIFDTYFSAPHGLTFAHAADLFGISYACPDSVGAFVDDYTSALESDRGTLLEIKTSREATHALHLEVLAEVAALLG